MHDGDAAVLRGEGQNLRIGESCQPRENGAPEVGGFPLPTYGFRSQHVRPSFHSGALRFSLVHSMTMKRAGTVRQSVSLPAVVAKRVRAIAKTRKLSANRVLVDLIETGLQARESERERFLTLARRFKESSDPKESDRLREELANVIFGE